MTMRQVQHCINAIGKRQGKEIALQASFHGIKVPFDADEAEVEPVEFDAAQEAAAARALEVAQERKLKEIAARGR